MTKRAHPKDIPNDDDEASDEASSVSENETHTSSCRSRSKPERARGWKRKCDKLKRVMVFQGNLTKEQAQAKGLEEVLELHLQHKEEMDKDTQMWAAVVEHHEQQCQTEMDVMSLLKPDDITKDLMQGAHHGEGDE